MLHHPCKLTALSHGGGCGCKIPPAALARLLSRIPPPSSPALLVGGALTDDAAVYRLDDERALIATADFFAPIVDDPFDFGRIAAANALSDVYAMGGRPALALNLVGAPLARIGEDALGEIARGGHEICTRAGVAVGGGHSIDAPEPFYGLAVTGFAPPAKIKTNAAAADGDALILGKPLGIGVLGAALKQGRLDESGYREMIRWTTRINDIGARLAEADDEPCAVHAMTDVTGFGLLGHLLEICRASGMRAFVRARDVPLIEAALALARAGFSPGATRRNWDGYRDQVQADALDDVTRALLADPQTNGGLLVACAQDATPRVLAEFHAQGYTRAACIGRLERSSRAGVVVEA